MTAGDRDRFGELKSRYRASLPAKARELRLSSEEVIRSRYDSESLSVFRMQVHRLAGSAGMYGHEPIERAARSVLDLLDGAGHRMSSVRQLEFEGAVAKLLSAMTDG